MQPSSFFYRYFQSGAYFSSVAKSYILNVDMKPSSQLQTASLSRVRTQYIAELQKVFLQTGVLYRRGI